MGRKDILLHSWGVVMEEEGWHPPLVQALEGVTETQADWRPEGGASNTIRETVHHLTFYKERLLQRLKGLEPAPYNGNTNTFQNSDPSMDWEQAIAKLVAVHREINGYLTDFQDADLDKPLPETPVGGQLLSLALHDAYHTGQIILLRKLQGSWPGSREFE
ncbi:DinB family protein [Paenibacillus montanisoli]|uniref:DinB family protein n=1 Tax=Paenibacillus montanisoli TaxID=2081970 RepID=A0A328TUU4_9BACL|nr:DinB family protein [Paenibacillus montanisoli]